MSSNKIFYTIFLLLISNLFYSLDSNAQINGQPPEGVSCVVSAGNRNAPLAVDGSYLISGIPGNLGVIRARATCSDGSIGQSGIGFTDATQSITIPLGPIQFGIMDPVPIAVNLSANETQLRTADTSQLTLTAVGIDGTSRDVTSRSEGTVYTISNSLLGTISEEGLVTVTGQFDTASSARIIVGATAEGSVSSSYLYFLGPRGGLRGTVYQSDGTTPVVGAQVSVLRLQPRESVGTVVTDGNGQFEMVDVNAGGFTISVVEPITGDKALTNATIESEGEVVDLSINLNGLGNVKVTVLNDNDDIVSNTSVVLTALGSFVETRSLITDEQGIALFNNVTVGDFTVSTRDPSTGLLGAIVDEIVVGETLEVILRLQETGAINGLVYDVDGTTLLSGIQVRLSSRERGVISQMTTVIDGVFSFDTLPKLDGPFILDAFVDGRLRARVPGIIFSTGEESLERDMILSSVGTVTGVVKNSNNELFANATVTMQSLEGLRLSFDALTNSNGEFVLPAVPLGDFELSALTQDGQTARASGRINADGDIETIDLVVVGNTIVGTVFQRNGTTPVGAGVTVYLAPKLRGEFYSYSGLEGIVSTVTDGQGRYGFPITQSGDYFVQAEQGLDRGRSRAILVNLDPSQPLETNVVFLAKGSVSGVVTDANGVAQNNATVTVITQGAFDATRMLTTNNQGAYNLNGVFAGDIVVTAINEITGQSGIRQARLDAEEEQINVDIVLAASGSIHGQVLKANGEVADQALEITVKVENTVYTNLTLSNGQFYEVLFMPLGDVEIIVEEITTGNRGIATTRIDSLNEVIEVDVNLIGQGQLTVNLLDINDEPVVDATVTATTLLPFRSTQEQTSDGNGRVIFERILAGDFSILAIKDSVFGSLQGSYTGTMLADVQQEASIVMEAIAVGSVSGVVYESDGITPKGAGWAVRMLPEPFSDAFVTFTNDEGEYSFNPVNAGTYTIDVYAFYDLSRQQCPGRGRILARASNVNITTQGQNAIADLQFLGAGEVFGIVTNNETPVSGIKITLTSPDPVFGFNSTCGGRTTYVTTTNALGEYTLQDIPAGNFTILAENSSQTLRAQGNDRIKFDTDSIELDLSLLDNVVTMPFDFYDANGFLSDVSGDGSLALGTRNVFASVAPDNGAMKLEIISNGVPVPFFNGDGTLGRLIADGQEIEVDDITPSGLFVTRRIFTPRSGYFSRYLEVLENPTDVAITVGVKVKSHHRQDDSNPRVVDTSDGDQVLSVINPALPDRWVVVDDQTDADPFENSSIQATGHVFDGLNTNIQVASASYNLIGQTGRLIYQWDNITVEPGQKVILMHFVFGQIKRTGARVAANRLMNLPPEAIDDLTSEEKGLILNFNVPMNSQLEQLPNLSAGQLSGQVLSGSGAVTVPNARVKFESNHPLFGRIRYVNSDVQGEYEFHSTLDGTVNNYVIPVFAFNISATYPVSDATSAITPGTFPVDMVTTIQDIIFIGKGDVRGSVLRHNGATVADTTIVMCKIDNRNQCFSSMPPPDNKTTSNADGTFIMYANTPRDYFIYADKLHPQNFGRNIHGKATVTATAADVAVVNIVLEETGSISGTIKASDGTPVSEAEVVLWDINVNTPSRIRKTFSDTAGFYRFFDVPLGSFEIRARDAISSATGTAQATVFVDQETSQNVDLLSTATLNVMVQYERGVFANDAYVSVNGSGFSQNIKTDTNGLAQFQLFAGEFNISASHPDTRGPSVTRTTLEIMANDSEVDITVVLPPAGEVFGTIIRPDGSTLAGGFPYEIIQIRGPSIRRIVDNTESIGSYREVGLPLGDYIITAFDAGQDRFADAEFSIVEDGEELLLNLTLLDERIALPADLYDANRFIFDLQHDGSIQTGSGAFSLGGSILKIDNQLFTGDTSARLQAGKRQFAITQDNSLSGIDVTRKIYVPRGAYFARYIEVLDNPTATDITVDVQLSNGYSVGEFIQTSTDDIDLSLLDIWVMIDDELDEDVKLFSEQMPVTVHLFGDNAMTLPPTSIDINYTNLQANIQQQWSSITIPAGQRVSLMHVVIQQINRTGAEYAANRLSQLPPELLTDLTISDIETTINFDLPVDGVSVLELLPPLTGSINGVVLEGNDINPVPVPETRVTVQSMHPLFSRIWGKISDGQPCPGPGTGLNGLNSSANDASYSLQGQLTDSDSIAIPTGVDIEVRAQLATPCYMGASGHPFTNAPSRTVLLEASGNQDVIFDTTVLTGTVTGTGNFAVTSGRLYRSIDNIGFPDYQYVPIANDGSYTYPGLVEGAYDLLFDTTHPDRYSGDDILRGSKLAVSVPFREVFVSDVMLQPTGSVQGTVLAFDSAPVVNAVVTLTSEESNQDYNQCETGCDINTLEDHKGKRLVSRRITTDSLGLYNFSAVPTGLYTMTVLDPVSNGTSSADFTVNVNQVAIQNIVLTAVGSAIITVNNASSNPVIDSLVYLTSDAEGVERVMGRTDFLGQLVVANIPLGGYNIRVTDPRAPTIRYMDRNISGTINSAGQANTHELALLTAAQIEITVINSDDGGAIVANANIKIMDEIGSRNLGNTDEFGLFYINVVPEGPFEITASKTENGNLIEVAITGDVLSTQDNIQKDITIDLRSTIVALPVSLRDANNILYQIRTNVSSNTLSKLNINGEEFISTDSALSQLNDRQFIVNALNSLSGLNVSRKIYVPRDGYFIRYIETLENPSNIAITVAVEVSGLVSRNIYDSSSGNDQLEQGDLWFVNGHSISSRGSSFITAGENSPLLPPLMQQNNINSNTKLATVNWQNVTVPANSRVQLLHFYVVQETIASAVASAQRLVQLPPEALNGLIENDIVEILNFSIPFDLIGVLDNLPELTGTISGVIYEGDAVTPVVNNIVTVTSNHILFNNTYTYDFEDSPDLESDENGNYSITGTLNGGGKPIAIPVDSSYTLSSIHPVSGLSATIDAVFNAGETVLIQDITFATGTIQGVVSGAFNPPMDFEDRIYVIQDGNTISQKDTNPDGSYTITGLAQGTYRVESRTGDFSSRLLGIVEPVSVTVGNTTTQNIVYEANGSVAGTVFSNTGIEQPDQQVEVSIEGTEFLRTMTTGPSGEYELGAIPVGDYSIAAINSDTNARVVEPISISANQVTQQDLTMVGTGSVTISVQFKAGGAVTNHDVYIESPTINGREYLGRTDGLGVLVAEISEGIYTLVTTHPQTGQEARINGMVNFADEQSSIDFIMPVSASFQFYVINSDQADAPIQGVKIRITDVNNSSNTGNATTGSNGFDTINNLIQATYLVNVEVDNNYESSFLLDISSDDDGLTINKTISFSENQHVLGGFNFGQAHYLQQIPLVIGQTLSLSIRHIIADFSCGVELSIFDPLGNFMAQGLGVNNGQVNQQARIDQIPILIDGRYTIEISPPQETCFSGSYRLSASIDGQSILVESFQTGGEVNGTLYQADSVTPMVGEIINLTTTAPGAKYAKQIITDSNGQYVFSSVPLGPFDLTYVERPTVSINSSLSTIGETLTQDLILSQTTIYNINVLNQDSTPINRQAVLEITLPGEPTLQQITNLQGQYTYTYYGTEDFSISVTDPSNSQVSTKRTLSAQDGTTFEIDLLLIPVTIHGIVYENDGVTIVSNANIWVYDALTSQFIKQSYSNQLGEYSLDFLPYNYELQLTVRDPSNNVFTQLPLITPPTQLFEYDIQLDGKGTVFGRLTGAGNVSISNARIVARYMNNELTFNNQRQLETTTNANGEYNFDTLPLNQLLTMDYSFYRNSTGDVTVQGETTLLNQGDSSEINLLLAGSAISLQLSTADNIPYGGMCDVSLDFVNNTGGGEVKQINRANSTSKGGGFGSEETHYNVNCSDLHVFAGFTENPSCDPELNPDCGGVKKFPESLLPIETKLGSSEEVTLKVVSSNGFDNIFAGTYQLIADDLVEVNPIFSVVKGNVTFNDSSVVQSAQISTLDKMTVSDELGNYRLVGQGLGVFRITAEDTSTNLQRTLESEITDIAAQVIIDIQLPASGTINGQVLDVQGLPMNNIEVYANSSASPVILQNTTDISGDYSMGNIAVGNVELSAVDQVTSNIASAQTQLNIDGEMKTQNLQFTQPGSVSGILNDENGAVLSGGCIKMHYHRAGSVHQGLNFSTISDANGDYSFPSASTGSVMVTGLDDCNNPTIATIESANIISNNNTMVDLQLGNAVPLMHELNVTGNGFGFKVFTDGSIQTENNVDQFVPNNSFIEPLSLIVNGEGLNNQPAAFLEDSGLEIEVGPTHTLNLINSRKIFAPTSGNYVRVLDSVTNTSLTNQQIKVSLQGSYGTSYIFLQYSSKVLLEVNPNTNNNHYAIQKFAGPANSEEFDPSEFPATTGYVFADVNNLMPVIADFQDERNRFAWSWTVAIQPGETLGFLSYILVEAPATGDITTLTTLAEKLVNGTQIDMYNGLSSPERSSIVNFGVPQ